MVKFTPAAKSAASVGLRKTQPFTKALGFPGEDMFAQAYGYKRWADERTLNAVDKIDNEEFPESYSFALQQINHIVIVEELFKSRLTYSAAPHKSTNTEVIPCFEKLKRRLIESGRWYENYVSSSKELSEAVSFVFTDGRSGKMTVEEILFHVITHGSYHRGNIARALDLASVPHPIDGYGIYIHKKEPWRRGT